MTLALFAAALAAGLAAEPARAGFLDKIKNKVEEKILRKAKDVEEKVEQQIENAVEQAQNGVATVAVEGAVGSVEGAIDGAVDGAVGSVEDAIDGAVDGAIREAKRSALDVPMSVPGRPGDGGAFFNPPPGASSQADVLAAAQARPRGNGQADYVSRMRRATQDKYYGFWGYWFGRQEQYETTLELLRAQRAQFLQFGAIKEAQAVEGRIEATEVELQEFVAAPPWEQLVHIGNRPGPFLLFGVDLASDVQSAGSIVPALNQLVQILSAAAQSAKSDDARQRTVDLARDLTSIRDMTEAGDIAGAQQIMDRRWAWIMAE
jgi:hypothetical protein